jgi:hypothetical protein
MPLPDGKSSHVQDIQPHPMGGLVVTFNTGARYHYPDAPEHLAAKCLSSPSVGQAFHNFIRSPYRGTKL